MLAKEGVVAINLEVRRQTDVVVVVVPRQVVQLSDTWDGWLNGR